jgi:hypothetical protein
MISVYRKADASGRQRWRLERRINVSLENLSPVLAVKLPRTVFATRRAMLLFDQGSLLTACVAKSSEIEHFVSIPYEIARSIVALPSAVIKVKINQAEKSQELIEAETKLFKIQEAHLKALQSGTFNSVGSVADPKPLETVNQTVGAWPETLSTPAIDAPPFSDEFFKTICNPGALS